MRKYFVITIITVAILGISWYGFAKGIGKKEVPYAGLVEAGFQLAGESTNELSKKDKEIIAEMQALFADLTVDTPLYMTGTMKAVDPSDTTASHLANSFVFYRNKELVYYATDQQTMVNDSIAYSVANHDNKQLLVMPPRTIAATQALPLSQLSKMLKEDNYQVERKEEKGLITFRLLNENHISCKEVRIQVNAESKTPVTIYYRFTDLEHPDDKGWDKELSLSFLAWQTGAQAAAAFVVTHPVTNTGGRFSPTKTFESYDITDLTIQ